MYLGVGQDMDLFYSPELRSRCLNSEPLHFLVQENCTPCISSGSLGHMISSMNSTDCTLTSPRQLNKHICKHK